MSYRVEQKISGTIYVYEATSYWDKEKKKSCQTRKIIGKRDRITGELIYNKPKEVIDENDKPFAKTFGNYYFFDEIAKEIGLSQILKTVFPTTYNEILNLAFYELSERKALYLCEYWCDTTEIKGATNLSSQRISDLLPSITDECKMNFFRKWCSYRLDKEYLAFDITSISSYSKLIEYVSFGYNRDKENLPQINLAMLFGQTSQLPIFYNFYEGGIKDVSTLRNMITFADELGIAKMKYVMDKGFYSETNIKNMLNKNIKFTIAVPFTNNASKKTVDGIRDEINHPNNVLCINDDIVFATTIKRKIGRKWVYEHVLFNEKHYIDEKENFYKKINYHENSFLKNKNHDLGWYAKFFTITKTKNRTVIQKNPDAIRDYLKYKGFLIIMSNDIKNAEEAVYTYRNKDIVEKSFDNLKNELDLKRLRIHSTDAMKGRIFIAFIALIILSHINKVSKLSGLNKKYSTEELICELKKINVIYFSNNRKSLTEISKNQRTIFKKFNIESPVL